MRALLLALLLPAAAAAQTLPEQLKGIGESETAEYLDQQNRKNNLTDGGTINGNITFAAGFGIDWADLTRSTTAAPSAAATATASSSTVNSVQINAITATSGGVCVSGSTLTITVSDLSRVKYSISSAGYHGSATGALFIAFLRDGIFIPPNTSTRGVETGASASINLGLNASTSWITEPLSAGTYSFCVTAWTNTGTVNFPVAEANGGSNKFWIEEIR